MYPCPSDGCGARAAVARDPSEWVCLACGATHPTLTAPGRAGREGSS